jgi:hypothetical protein
LSFNKSFGFSTNVSGYFKGSVTNWGLDGNVAAYIKWVLTAGGLGLIVGTFYAAGALKTAVIAFVKRNTYLKEILVGLLGATIGAAVFNWLAKKISNFITSAVSFAEGLKIPYAKYVIWKGSKSWSYSW